MPNKKWFWNDIADGLLRRMYDPTVRGRSQEIAARLKVPRWAVNRRAAALGLSRPKDRPWSAEDEAYVEANFHHTWVKTLARRLGRSPTAVQLKAKRLGVRKYAEGYTALSLAEALGVDPHWVLARIRSGKLRASHRQTERKPGPGHECLNGKNAKEVTRTMAVQGFQSHDHEEVIHNHEHMHVTHHARGGLGGAIEHLTAIHTHDHNHSTLGHAHTPHENAAREHEHEAHIHDHAHPAES